MIHNTRNASTPQRPPETTEFRPHCEGEKEETTQSADPPDTTAWLRKIYETIGVA